MKQDIQPRKETQAFSNVATPANLIKMALEKGADIDQIEKLMQMQERYDAKQAKSAFLSSLTKFQSIVPRITKSKQGHNYKYAPLADIVEQIRDYLQDCGLSFRFEQRHKENIEVTCIISHIEGHSESTTMEATADTSGSKNSVQAVGSTVQYLQRYTLIGALGLTTADEDIDARLPCEKITSDQVVVIQEILAKLEHELVGITKSFYKWLSKPPMKCSTLEEIPFDKFDSIVSKINDSADMRRKNANN